MSELVLHTVGIDEFEAMRLCDHEGMSQIEAAAQMQVSRGTVQRLLEKGRKTLLEAIITNGALGIADDTVVEGERVKMAGDL